MLDAVAEVEIPAGVAGIPLLRARAELAEGCGRIPEALTWLQDAARRDPEDAAALVAVARLRGIQALSGDAVDEDLLDSSAEAYMAAIGRDGDNEAAAAGLSWLANHDYGRLWRMWRNPRVRERCLRVQEALAQAVPDDAWAWGNLANTLRVLGRTDDALAAYATARAANPYDPSLRSDEGLALSAAGRPAEALAAYEASLELDGGHLAGRQNGARGLYLLGRDAEAAAHLGAAARTARAIGRSPGTYRFLLDRTWRAGRRSDLR